MSAARLHGAVAVAVAIASVPVAGAAPAPPDPRRGVAVLEYRAGSAELPAIDVKSSAILRKQTSLGIVDTSDARRTLGAQVDGEVAACRGEAPCIARLGRQLGVDEVLLVGVSEFGDVILTLQRIDVGSGRVLARVAEALAADANPGAEQIADYLRRVMPKSDFLRYGVLHIEANVSGAAVVVGREPRGVTPLGPIRVEAPAAYEITLTKDGYVPFSATVAVPPDAEVNVRPVLSERSGSAWYTQWWVAAIAGTVVVGAITAGVILAQDEPSSVPWGIEF